MLYMKHPDPEVQRCLDRLNDALCQWERATYRRSILILKEEAGYLQIFDSGKRFDFEGIPIEHLLNQIK